jgi:uncharacterized membrane protein
MNGLALFLSLRLLHVVAGAAWVGALLFIARFLLPTVSAIGPAGGAVMQHLTQVRRLQRYMMGTALLTIFSGFALYWHAAQAGPGWPATRSGQAFGLGGLLGVLAVILGVVVNSPTAQRLGALAGSVHAAGRPPTAEEQAELGRLRTRLGRAGNAAAILVVLAVAMMAVARYLP